MSLYYREFGQGSPVFLLHGLFGFSDNLQTIAKGLSNEYWVITPDHRNHGRSPHLPAHTYADMAGDLRDFMNSQGILQASFVGHSMGGKVAMQLALTFPELVEKLVVVDIAPGQATDGHSDIFKALLDINLSAVNTRSDAESALAKRIPDPSTLQFLLKNITRHPNGAYTWKMNLPVLWAEYPSILAAVSGYPYDGPTLFIRGAQSRYILDSDLPLIRDLFPNARLETIAGAGHWVHADKPAELLGLLREFLPNAE
ncbi:MAG: alpha/beta fold hydrolase [Saprospiraceae bacterium]|nr:alpha/beta fold hydrolase [Saprospiraceae bacterium]